MDYYTAVKRTASMYSCRALQNKLLSRGEKRGRRHGFDPWVRKKIPWSMKWQPILVFLPGKFHRQKSLVRYSSWGVLFLPKDQERGNQTREKTFRQ